MCIYILTPNTSFLLVSSFYALVFVVILLFFSLCNDRSVLVCCSSKYFYHFNIYNNTFSYSSDFICDECVYLWVFCGWGVIVVTTFPFENNEISGIFSLYEHPLDRSLTLSVQSSLGCRLLNKLCQNGW